MQLRLLDVIEVDPDVRDLLARWAITPAVPVSELTAEAVRKDDCGVLALQRTPGALHSVEDVEVIGPAGPLSVRVYRPSPGRLHPVLFLHGGGFVIGREGYDAPLRELALASGCLIVAPECRLAPEHPFPAALEDGLRTMAQRRGSRARRVPRTARHSRRQLPPSAPCLAPENFVSFANERHHCSRGERRRV